MIDISHKKVGEELSKEIEKLIEEYARLKNKPGPFENEHEKALREEQLGKDRSEKWQEFEAVELDFGKKRDYFLKLKKEVETMRAADRKDELVQKLKDQNITEKELFELQALIDIL